MKRKTNISVQDNYGIRRTANMIVSEKYNGFQSGDILDANTVVAMIKYAIEHSGGGHGGAVTSEDIVNGTIQLEDLSNEVTNKMESEYEDGNEVLYLNGSKEDNN